MNGGCPFCEYDGPSRVLAEWNWVNVGLIFVIEPLNPVTDGHALVIPRRHVPDACADPILAGECFRSAAAWARGLYGSVNLITSVGVPATQSVRHLHVHVVPRREGDGLLLPWSAPDARQGFAAAIDLIDEHVGMDDETMNPIRAAYRQLGGE